MDAWLSMDIQLKPQLEWGIACVSAPPKQLKRAMSAVHHSALSPLRVCQKINKAVRMLPFMYQGLDMWDINTDCLGAKIYMLQRHWNGYDALGQMLK